ncbi:histidine kinase group protein [Pochonia chlamydosporia 170]|uniref:Histidine kinase group protein n=1 Tax=Pochonia chlamydosporia 170 TaxID=1380566 RepID=A0A179FGL2_METCM|nr:histidine kinase group protein [Pochonia chlamydosporia 170]OAQ64674.1 histidine kinase group protein [Pochonia chlamydosporia 170]
MSLPFNPNRIKRNARAYGFNTQEAAIFTHIALDQLRDLNSSSTEPVTLERIAQAIKQYATNEVEREKAIKAEVRDRGISILDDMEADLLEMGNGVYEYNEKKDPEPRVVEEEADGQTTKRFKFDDDGLEQYFGRDDPYNSQRESAPLSLKHYNQDLITAMCSRVELAVELGKHLAPEDMVNLYATSRTFHNALNEHMLSSIRMWIDHRAPEAGKVFQFRLYRRYLVTDPAGRTWHEQCRGSDVARTNPRLMTQIRSIPGLRYLQLVLGRDRCCRQILGIMARNGFLMPKSMHGTLLRLWLLMDVPTSGQRQAFMRNKEIWSNEHIYNAQMFFMKLLMAFNDPTYGPGGFELLHLILGQKGLYPLWQLLMRKKFTTLSEIIDLQVRYQFDAPPELVANPDGEQTTIHGVPLHEVGVGHYEGWGLGDNHLLRPDELIPIEGTARTLHLEDHLMYMMMWGYCDTLTGENIVPTEEELYISDEENTLKHMDTSYHWRKKHALKKKFFHLSEEEKEKILDDDEDDRLRALAWTGEVSEYDCDGENQLYTLDEEIDRGFIVRPPRNDGNKVRVPKKNDKQGWEEFVNAALTTVVPEISGDQELRAQAWHNYHKEHTDGDWDWEAWLDQEQADKARPRDDSEEAETIVLEDEEMHDDESVDEYETEDGGAYDDEQGDPLLRELSAYLNGHGVEPSESLKRLLGNYA